MLDKFVHAAGGLADDFVIEVGGGPGSLSRSILSVRPTDGGIHYSSSEHPLDSLTNRLVRENFSLLRRIVECCRCFG